MHRPARRRGPALVTVAVLLGVIGGTSLGLVNGTGAGPTVVAQAPGATAAAPSSSRPAAAAPVTASASRASGGAPAEQRLSAPRRQLDRGVKAGKSRPRHREPGDSGKGGHGDRHGHGKGKQSHGR